MNRIPKSMKNHVHIPRTFREATGRHAVFEPMRMEWKEAEPLTVLYWICIFAFCFSVAYWTLEAI